MSIRTDVVVIGAGPVGLFQAFQLGLLGLDVHLIDALPYAGGQCAELYADKPLYDIPGFASLTGQQLTQNLLSQLQQLRQFARGGLSQRLHTSTLVTGIAPLPAAQGSDGYSMTAQHTNGGRPLTLQCSAICMAAGTGAFLPRTLNVPNIEQVSTYIHHRPSEPSAFVQADVVIVGEHDEAINWACTLALSGQCRSVTLNHRRAQLQASPLALQLLNRCLAQDVLHFQPGLVQGVMHSAGALQALKLLTPEGKQTELACTHLGVFMGLSPQLGPLSRWGLALERKRLPVHPASCATSTRGIYAVGDISSYPGKQRLIVCGFHEATLAAHAILAQLKPEHIGPLQYTTSSAALQARLQLSPK